MGDPRYRREAVRALEYMIPECRSDLNCIVHDADLPFPDYLKAVDYHLIVLGPTFLCDRHSPIRLKLTLKEYRFIEHSSACKIALPQDDYDSSEILDNWLVQWKMDRVYSVIHGNWDVIYPRYSAIGDIQLGFTGYITKEWIDSWANPKPHEARDIDVSYRTHSYSQMRCSVRHLKFAIADRFVSKVSRIEGAESLELDISSQSKDLIPGELWHKFIENSRFCLVTPSGSSVLDKTGALRKCVDRFVRKNPNTSFELVRTACLAGEDRRYILTAISPRNIEAALAETVQIATPGSYSGLMQPMEHFIPLEEDCSNIEAVLVLMRNKELVQRIKCACKESILAEPRLRREVIVDEIITFAQSTLTSRQQSLSINPRDAQALNQYRAHIDQIAKRIWQKRQRLQSLRERAIRLGARQVKQWLLSKFITIS